MYHTYIISHNHIICYLEILSIRAPRRNSKKSGDPNHGRGTGSQRVHRREDVISTLWRTTK